MWVTKDQNLPDPVQISAEAEKGSYVFFNHNTWNRVRVGTTRGENGEAVRVQSPYAHGFLSLELCMCLISG